MAAQAEPDDIGTERADLVEVAELNRLQARSFVDELASAGLTDVCLSPGSRSAPLALAFAEHPGVRVWTCLDERSAGFFALGAAKAVRRPVAVLCTSGTAAANYLPAVLEARYGRVPLVVITADRPGELADAGANQTIDQIRLYGQHTKWFVQVSIPSQTEPAVRYTRTAARRAYATALDTPSGPVHVNFPFPEPLVPPPGDLAPRHDWHGEVHTSLPRVALGRRRLAGRELEQLASYLSGTERGLIVCGPEDRDGLAGAVAQVASCLGYPVLADPLSNLRCGSNDQSPVVDSYDAFLRSPESAGLGRPVVILRFGAYPTSKALAQYLESCRCELILVDDGGWRDPLRIATRIVQADPVQLCRDLADRLPDRPAAPSSWTRSWQYAGSKTRAALQRRLGSLTELFEGKVFSELAELLPDGSTLVVGNSMPVRDLDTFFPSTPKRIRMLGNRGVSGIDGVLSTALGVVAKSAGPVMLVVGDLSFLHDLNALQLARAHELDLTVVLLNNDGGGIFSFLPQADYVEHFEQLFGTPHGLDLGALVTAFGWEHCAPADWDSFRAAVARPLARSTRVVEIRTERRRNVELHDTVIGSVSAALTPAGVHSGE